MNHLQITGLVLVASAILLGAGVYIGRWVSHQLQLAELRNQKHKWEEEVAPKIARAYTMWLPNTNYYQNDVWAASEEHYYEFPKAAATITSPKSVITQTGPKPTLVLKVESSDITPPEYDSELDTRIYMARQAEETQAFLRQLRER